MSNHLPCFYFNVADGDRFFKGLQEIVNSLSFNDGIYAGDNIFTYGRNLGFLDDKNLMTAFEKNAENIVEKTILWRTASLLWGVRNGLRLEGDFVEGGCYKGTTARILCEAVNFNEYNNRHYYLYDLFEHDASMNHHAMPEHGKALFEQVKDRFSDFSNVTVTQGKVPDVLRQVAPEKIAFMHLDMNNAEAEVGALDVLFERMVPGAILILDDYGWMGYRDQKTAEDAWFAERGYQVLEMPTGQGMVIKQKW